MNWALLGGSLAAVLALAGVAALLRLGGARIADADEACAAAEDAVAGFDAVDATVDRDGRAALVEGCDGSAVVLKVAGARLAARHLPRNAAIERSGTRVTIETGDRWFGRVTLNE